MMDVISFRSQCYPYLVWMVAALFLFYKYFLEVSPSVMSHQLMSTFDANGAQLGNLAACYYYAYLLMQIPVGMLLDRYGPRRLTTLAILLCVLGVLILSTSHTLLFAQFGRFITGIGAAFAAVNCLKLTAVWFEPRRFSVMAGLMVTIGMLGAIGGQGPLASVIGHVGWRDALQYGAAVGGILALLFWLIVRDRRGKHQKHVDCEKTISPKMWTGLFYIVKQVQNWPLAIYSGLAFAPITMFSGLWGVPYLMTAYHLPQTVAASCLSLVFIGFAMGTPICGWLSDLIGQRKIVMTWGIVIALIIISIILYVPYLTLWLISLLLLCFGMSLGCFLLSFTMICEINPFMYAATALGFMNAFNAIIGAISDPLVGKLLDIGWDGKFTGGIEVFSLHDYRFALSIIPIYLLIALLLLCFIKETLKKHK